MDVIEVFKLYGSILVDSSKAEQSIQKTSDKAEGLGSKLGRGIATAGKWGMAIGAGAAVVGAAVGKIVTSTADAQGAISDAAQRTGETAEEYQKYAYAAKLSGIETEKLEGLMKKQQKAFSDAKTGGKETGEAYKQLGIDISTIGTSGEAFDAVVKKMAGMEDVNERNALANKLFGKSYADLAPLLAEGADGIEALKQEAVDMGAVMSDESVAAGEKFGDTLDTLKMAGKGLFNQLGTQLMPYMQKGADWIIRHMPQIKQVAKSAFETIAKVVKTAGDVFKALLPILKPIWDFISWAFPKILDTVSAVFGAIKPIIKAVSDVFTGLADAIQRAYDKWNKWATRQSDHTTTAGNEDIGGGGTGGASRASGVAYVPYDGFLISAHKGERLLTRGEVANQDNRTSNITINVTGNNIASDYDVNKIGTKLADIISKENRCIPNRAALIPTG